MVNFNVRNFVCHVIFSMNKLLAPKLYDIYTRIRNTKLRFIIEKLSLFSFRIIYIHIIKNWLSRFDHGKLFHSLSWIFSLWMLWSLNFSTCECIKNWFKTWTQGKPQSLREIKGNKRKVRSFPHLSCFELNICKHSLQLFLYQRMQQ